MFCAEIKYFTLRKKIHSGMALYKFENKKKKKQHTELGLSGCMKILDIAMHLKSSSDIFLWPQDTHASFCLAVILLLSITCFAVLIVPRVRTIVYVLVLHLYSCL